MATVTATVQAYQSGQITSSAWIGYSSEAIRTVRYQFTTGSEGATTIKFSFNGPTNPSVGKTGASTAASINWYVTKSENSHASAGASAEKNGTCSAEPDNSHFVYKISASGAVNLLPNTTYYLWLFPNHSTSNYYLIINDASSMQIELSGTTVHTLSFSAGIGTTLTVKKNGSALTSGTTVYTGDEIAVSFSANEGYTGVSCTVSGKGSFSSNFTFTVSTDHTITTSASVLKYNLTIDAKTGSTITVERISSPKQGASNGELSNGDYIYYSDQLKITFGASTGYNLGTHTVNGEPFTSGNTITVKKAISVASTASLKSYTLTINSDAHSIISVYKNGMALSGNTIYHFDKLSIVVTAKSGYKIKSANVNGETLIPNVEKSYEVSGNVTIYADTSALGFVYIANSSGTISPYIIYVGSTDGSSLERYRSYMGTENNGIVAY